MHRNAYTLLEIVLALALASVVLGILGMAVDIHLSAADSGRNQVEQAQLARTLLHRIAEDLRATAPYSATQQASSDSETGSAAADATTGTTGSGTSSQGADSGTTTQGTDDGTTTQQFRGGLQGNRYQLQFEISRLPRPRVPAAGDASGGLLPTDRLSDGRVVSYGVVDPADGLSTESSAAPTDRRGGLVRREMESAAYAAMVDQGQLSDLDRATEVLAPEVVAVEFAYYDGTTSCEEWDSGTQGRLPTAISATVYLRRPQRRRALISFTELAPESDLISYSLLVPLPNAQVVESSSSSTSSQSSAAPKEVGASGSGSSSNSSGSGQPSNPSGSGQPSSPSGSGTQPKSGGSTGKNSSSGTGTKGGR
jgi:hypothetical protein